MNWDGTQPLAAFLADWAAATTDRAHVPQCGDSSRQAGERLHDLLAAHCADPGAIAVVTHGGIIVDLLRTLLGDDRLPPRLLHEGIPPGALTILQGLTIVEVASVAHLGVPVVLRKFRADMPDLR